MAQMTPRERFLNALSRRPVDRAPVANPTSVVTEDLQAAIGAPLIFHCCGRTMDRIQYFNENCMAAFHFESTNDAFEVKEQAAMVLIGNINNPETLLSGTVEDVRREVFRALEAGVDIIAPECAVPLDASMDNIRAIRECVDEYYAR